GRRPAGRTRRGPGAPRSGRGRRLGAVVPVRRYPSLSRGPWHHCVGLAGPGGYRIFAYAPLVVARHLGAPSRITVQREWRVEGRMPGPLVPATAAARRRSYQPDISYMGSHAADQATRSDARPVPQPQRSTIQANTVGEAALTTRTGVAMTPRTAP